MRKFICFMAVATLFLVACGGGSTEAQPTGEPTSIAPGASDAIPKELLSQLTSLNREHYGIGCTYASEAAWEADDWTDTPPIAAPSGATYWGVDTLSAFGFSFGMFVTLFDPNSGPTNANDFTKRIDGGRTCYTPQSPKTDCVYELHNDLTSETTEVSDFPANVYPSSIVESNGAIVAVAISDPKRPERDETLIIPACKRDEAAAIITARQKADSEQAKQSVPFEQRVYP